MKNLLLILFVLPISLFGQYVLYPTNYDSETASEHIIHGDLKYYLTDSVEITTQRNKHSYTTTTCFPKKVVKKVYKVLTKGIPEYSGRTNGGYTFSISVIDFNDDTKIINKVVFVVSPKTQKIVEVEILLGE